jgi:hypothetical protein
MHVGPIESFFKLNMKWIATKSITKKDIIKSTQSIQPNELPYPFVFYQYTLKTSLQ